MKVVSCPCGSGQAFKQCCSPLINGERQASTPEQLMRSRYTAYGLHRDDYLLQTWADSSRPSQLNTQEEPVPRWIGLRIKRSEVDSSLQQGLVEFVATYKLPGGGPAQRLHEVSRFIQHNSRWFYLDGDILDS